MLFYDNGIKFTEDFGSELEDRYPNINFVKDIGEHTFVGTRFDYLWRINDDRQFVVPGMTNSTSIERLFVDSEHSLWIIPWVLPGDNWWNRVERMTRRQEFSGIRESQNFGTMGSCRTFWGITQYDENTMFLSNCSEPLKAYDLQNNTWGNWIFGGNSNHTYFTNTFHFDSEFQEYEWTKIDGLIRDRRGIVWGTWWRNLRLSTAELPVVFAFDPNNGKFRFLLKNTRAELNDPYKFAMLGNGDLLLAFANRNELWLIDSSKDPFDESVSEIADASSSSGLLKSERSATNAVTAMAATGAGNVLVGTIRAPVVFNHSAIRGSNLVTIDNIPDRFSVETSDIVLEYSQELWSQDVNLRRTRSVFWVANGSLGVQRLVLDEYMRGDILEAAVFDASQTVFALNSLNGGINGTAMALAIDTVQNFLWIGGDRGITRIRLPERTSVTSQQRGAAVFPNPFSLSRHTFLTLPSVSQSSFVDVYTVSGKLVHSFNQNSPEWTKTIDGSHFYRWRVPSNIAPGTYIIAVKELEGDRIARKNTKTYKLVIIP
jgi:hypothetical protein